MNCPNCGAVTTAEEKKCPYCGTEIRLDIGDIVHMPIQNGYVCVENQFDDAPCYRDQYGNIARPKSTKHRVITIIER